METIERTPPASEAAPFFEEPAPAVRPSIRWPLRLWRETVAFLTISAVGLGVAGLMAVRDFSASAWRQAFGDFHWVVLVTGDAVELDEIGRYLKQMDNVAEVTLFPSDAVIDRLRREPLLERHVGVLDPARLPSFWRVNWAPTFDASRMDDLIAEIRRLPGVMDVAFDIRELDKVRYFRAVWFKVRLLLSSIALVGILLGAVVLGRFLFFAPPFAFSALAISLTLMAAMAAWVGGLAGARVLVGDFSWQLAWGGLAAGIVRVAASRTRPTE